MLGAFHPVEGRPVRTITAATAGGSHAVAGLDAMAGYLCDFCQWAALLFSSFLFYWLHSAQGSDLHAGALLSGVPISVGGSPLGAISQSAQEGSEHTRVLPSYALDSAWYCTSHGFQRYAPGENFYIRYKSSLGVRADVGSETSSSGTGLHGTGIDSAYLCPSSVASFTIIKEEANYWLRNFVHVQ